MIGYLPRSERVNQIISDLRLECAIQYHALEKRGDVYWDCYNKERWKDMVETIDELKTLIDGETQENKPEITREYGKEL